MVALCQRISIIEEVMGLWLAGMLFTHVQIRRHLCWTFHPQYDIVVIMVLL